MDLVLLSYFTVILIFINEKVLIHKKYVKDRDFIIIFNNSNIIIVNW